MTRLFDFFCALIGILLLSPLFLLISIGIVMDSGFPVFYLQDRVGKNFRSFKLMKFRTMTNNADKSGLLTIGEDSRITKIGSFLRKYKLDEFPQLFNVLKGEMALVGPRPEVKKYVDLYNESQRKVLDVRPGITDLASIEYLDENELLGKSENPEKTYIEEVMPHKLDINLKYMAHRSFFKNIGVLLKTVFSILR